MQFHRLGEPFLLWLDKLPTFTGLITILLLKYLIFYIFILTLMALFGSSVFSKRK
jgi:hypothetical protein